MIDAAPAKPFDVTFARANREVTKTVPVRIAELTLDQYKIDEIVRRWIIENAIEAIGEPLTWDDVQVSADVSSFGDFIGYGVTITKEVK